MYKENPKTKGSGILCAIPQATQCKQGCKDCFFQSGRSYLEPLKHNLPNVPETHKVHNIVRVNDGNDSSDNYENWIEDIESKFDRFFLNTSRIDKLTAFKHPFVLTVNPGNMTDTDFHRISNMRNLMFVRIRANTWNMTKIVKPAVHYYTRMDVPVVLTFMAYHDKKDIDRRHLNNYVKRKRTVNEYYAIDKVQWFHYMKAFYSNKYVFSCGKEGIASECRFCGNCIREYHATVERLSHL